MCARGSINETSSPNEMSNTFTLIKYETRSAELSSARRRKRLRTPFVYFRCELKIFAVGKRQKKPSTVSILDPCNAAVNQATFIRLYK